MIHKPQRHKEKNKTEHKPQTRNKKGKTKTNRTQVEYSKREGNKKISEH